MNAAEYIVAHPGIRPGHRAYGCALVLSKSGRRVLTYLAPGTVELCSYDIAQNERLYRPTSSSINYIVPVNPDRTLDWGLATSRYTDVCLSDDPQEIMDDMLKLCQAACARIDTVKASLDKTRLWIDNFQQSVQITGNPGSVLY